MTPTQTVCTLEETHTGKTWAMVTLMASPHTILALLGQLQY